LMLGLDRFPHKRPQRALSRWISGCSIYVFLRILARNEQYWVIFRSSLTDLDCAKRK